MMLYRIIVLFHFLDRLLFNKRNTATCNVHVAMLLLCCLYIYAVSPCPFAPSLIIFQQSLICLHFIQKKGLTMWLGDSPSH